MDIDNGRKIELIRRFVNQQRGEELRLMLIGASKYCLSSNDRNVIYPTHFAAHDPKGFHLMTWVHTHLEFTAAFGTDLLSATREARQYFANPEEYDMWLSEGAPGLFVDELEAFANDLLVAQPGVQADRP